MLIHRPMLFLHYFDDAIREVQRSLLATHDERNFMAYKASVHARLCRLPYCPELRKQTVSSLRAADVNRLIQVQWLPVIRESHYEHLDIAKLSDSSSSSCSIRFLVL